MHIYYINSITLSFSVFCIYKICFVAIRIANTTRQTILAILLWITHMHPVSIVPQLHKHIKQSHCPLCNIVLIWVHYHRVQSIPYSGKVWQRESLKNWLFSSLWQKKVWQTNRLLIVSTNLDGFSLVNHRRFAKFSKLPPAKLFHYTVIITLTNTTIDYAAEIKLKHTVSLHYSSDFLVSTFLHYTWSSWTVLKNILTIIVLI